MLPSATGAQAPAAPSSSPSPAAPSSTLRVSLGERQYFQFGYLVAKSAFAYAELAKKASAVSKTKNKLTQVKQLGALATVAQHNRAQAHDGFVRCLSLMQNLDAPEAAQAPVAQAIARLDRPVALTPDAKGLAAFNQNAAQTLSALNEFERLSALPEHAAIQKWLQSPASNRTNQVWYAEGLIAALAEVASAFRMPELLPPVSELATDLRGLRDWLALRLPDPPTADQLLLRKALDDFLRRTAAIKKRSKQPLSLFLLAKLGDISQKVRAQILSTPGSPPTVNAPPPAPQPTPETKTPTGLNPGGRFSFWVSLSSTSP